MSINLRARKSFFLTRLLPFMGVFLLTFFNTTFFWSDIFEIETAYAWPPNPKTDYTTLNNPENITVGDVDDDGDIDLVQPNGEFVSVFLNEGAGTYAAKADYRVTSSGSGQYAKNAVIGDFNSDSNVDIATITDSGSSGSSYIAIVVGYGDGTFSNWPTIYQTTWSFGETGSDIAASDLDGDTDLDIVVTNSYYTGNFTLGIFLGNGAGSFSGPTQYNSSLSDGPCSYFVLDDFSGDTYDDIMCSSGNKLLYWEGNGNGTFDAYVAYSPGSTITNLAAGDFDGDTDLDVAVTFYNTGNVGVFLNNGSGVFGSVTTYSAGASASQLWGITAADLDGDGNVDISTGRYLVISSSQFGTQVATLMGNGDGTFDAAEFTTVGTAPRSMIAATLNNDLYPDLAVLNYGSSSISVLLNTVPPASNELDISATVESASSITFSANAIGLGSLSTLSVNGSSVQIDVTSNATNGYSIYLDDVNDAGFSTGVDTIPMTTGTLSAGNEGAGWSIDVAGTNVAYNGGTCPGNNAVTDIGNTAFQAITATEPTSQIYNLCFAAAIANTTAAGNYSHVVQITFVSNY